MDFSLLHFYLLSIFLLIAKEISGIRDGVPALGRDVKLGTLYDARTGSFLESSIFNSEVPSTCMNSLDTPWSSSPDMEQVRSYSDKLELLNMNNKELLGLGVLIGLIKTPERNLGSYLTSPSNPASDKHNEFTFYETSTSKFESISIGFTCLEPLFNENMIRTTSATHFVTGITYGCGVIVDVIQDNAAVRREPLNADFLRDGLTGNLEFTTEDEANLTVNIYSVLPDTIPANPTLRNARLYVNGSRGLIRATKQGKGKPMTYTLLEVNSLRSILQMPNGSHDAPRESDNAGLTHRAVTAFQKLRNVEDGIADAKVRYAQPAVSLQAQDEFFAVERNFTNISTTYRSQVKQYVSTAMVGEPLSATLTRDLENTIEAIDQLKRKIGLGN